MGGKANNLALQTYPSPKVWKNMNQVAKSAEYTRHIWLVGSGVCLGSLIIPSVVL
jgi:hypothetical protein